MSWDISLEDQDGQPGKTTRHVEGGTYQSGGCPETTLNVTYNYGDHFQFRNLHGRTGRETVKELSDGVDRFGTLQDDDYWAATEGNAGYALSILRDWAKLYPDHTWRVS